MNTQIDSDMVGDQSEKLALNWLKSAMPQAEWLPTEKWSGLDFAGCDIIGKYNNVQLKVQVKSSWTAAMKFWHNSRGDVSNLRIVVVPKSGRPQWFNPET